jgi:hypothetical protein
MNIFISIDEDNDIYEMSVNGELYTLDTVYESEYGELYTLDTVYESEYGELFDELNMAIEVL